jgi:hypothetical protein
MARLSRLNVRLGVPVTEEAPTGGGPHTSEGILVSGIASTLGEATKEGTIEWTSEGTLVSGIASTLGIAELEHTSVGALVSDIASTLGIAELEHTSVGAMLSAIASTLGEATGGAYVPKHIRPATMIRSQAAYTNGTATVNP